MNISQKLIKPYHLLTFDLIRRSDTEDKSETSGDKSTQLPSFMHESIN